MSPDDPVLAHLRDTLGFQYEFGRTLGRGGMGVVYAARERALDRDVAIKVLLPDAAETAEARERFLREARTAAKLTHPGIVPLHTFGDTGTVLYLVMGLVHGESLEARLRRAGRLQADEAQRILEELTSALSYAHGKGIVHRDIKPDNILIDFESGCAMLSDFGIARQVTAGPATLTQVGMIVGTPTYMSPEQAAGDRELDGRSDIYALGLVGYAMLTGRPPFESDDVRDLLLQQMSRAPVPLRTMVQDVPMELAATVERCLRKDPSERWSDASHLLHALQGQEPDDDGVGLRMAKKGGWIVQYGALVLLDANFAWWAFHRDVATEAKWMTIGLFAFLPAVMAADCWRLREKGMTWSEIRGLMIHAPAWWPFWWPARLRRTGDVWAQLPRMVRANRLLRMLGFAFGAIAGEALYLFISPPKTGWIGLLGIAAGSFLAGLGALIMSAVSQYLWGRRHGLSAAESDRVAATPTAKSAFWKRPHIARLLAGAPASPIPSATPEDSAELLRAIREVAARLPPAFSTLGRESLEAGRQLVDVLTELDREIASVARDADPAEQARLEQRLARFRSSEGGGDEEMARLYAAQLALLQRLSSRLDELTARRRRIPELLRLLWLQLTALRGDIASSAEDSVVTGRIRAVIADADAYSSGVRLAEATSLAPP